MTEQSGADLSRLRIQREVPGSPAGGRRPRTGIVLYLLGAAAITAAVIFFIRTLGNDPGTIDTTIVSYISSAADRTLLTASGYVVAQRKAALASKATGRIVALYYREGDRVKKGDVIAKIESEDVEAALSQARAELAVSQASLFEAGRLFGRAETLLAGDLISQAEYDMARSQYDAAVATVDSREAALRSARVNLENTSIRAPFDGTILSKNADVGEVVAPFAAGASSRVAVVTLADMGSLQVEADVSESNIEGVTLRQPVEITLDAYPERRYRGRVDKIVPTADRAKATVLTKIQFLEIDGRVLPEMGAKVHFLRGTEGDSLKKSEMLLVVDARAVVRRENGPALFLLEGTKAVLRPVRTGKNLGSMVEILEGVSAGARVILTPPASLEDGGEVALPK
jgi:RND family efflux transporter MFP subunit